MKNFLIDSLNLARIVVWGIMFASCFLGVLGMGFIVFAPEEWQFCNPYFAFVILCSFMIFIVCKLSLLQFLLVKIATHISNDKLQKNSGD